MYEEIAPNGVRIVSEVPFLPKQWRDHSFGHLFWSYSAWGTLILSALGWKLPRRVFNRYWNKEL